jgi:hypothetical protein
MDHKTKMMLQGIYMVPLIVICAVIFMAFEITLMILICGPALIPAGILLFPCLLIEGHGEPWKAKRKWIRYPSIPFLKCHAFFCKIQGMRQRL